MLGWIRNSYLTISETIFLASFELPQLAISCKTGIRLFPEVDNEYSILVMSTLDFFLSIKPSASSSFNSLDNTLFEIAGIN